MLTLEHFDTALSYALLMMAREKMKDLPGSRELVQDIEELKRRFVETLSPEERLRGLPAEERLRDLPPEERLRGLHAEEILRGLPPEERARLRALLDTKS